MREGNLLRELYCKLTVIVLILLGFVTLIPWGSSRNNILGYSSVCTFAPFATIGLFSLGAGVHAWHKKRKVAFWGMVLVLLVVLGFTGWWFYSFKIPMDSIGVSMTITTYWIGSERSSAGLENTSVLWFNLTIKNFGAIATPLFTVDVVALAVNNTKLVSGYSVDMPYVIKWLYKTTLQPGENVTFRRRLLIYYDNVETVGETKEELWNTMHETFNFTINGVFTARPFTANVPYPYVDLSVWAAKAFTVTQLHRQIEP